MLKFSITVLAFFCTFLSVSAQISGGIFLGATNYQGDLVKGIADFKSTNPRLSVFAMKAFNDPRFAIKAALSFGDISGDDAHYESRKNRGLSFKTPLTQLSAHVEWSPFLKTSKDDSSGVMPIKQKSLFFNLGLGANLFDPITIGLTPASKDYNKKIAKVQMMFPIGVGYRININENWAIAAELTTQLAFTDYLDGVSWSGNPNNNDWVTTVGLSIAYKLSPTSSEDK